MRVRGRLQLASDVPASKYVKSVPHPSRDAQHEDPRGVSSLHLPTRVSSDSSTSKLSVQPVEQSGSKP